MPPLQVRDMIRLLRLCQRVLPLEDCGHDLVHLTILDDRFGERLDVADHAAEIADTFGAVRLEGRLAGECDHRMHEDLGDCRAVFNGAQVAVVLADRIREGILDRLAIPLPAEALRPYFRIPVAEDPSLVVFGLDDEQPISANHDMIDLRRRPVRQRKIDVIQYSVLPRIQSA